MSDALMKQALEEVRLLPHGDHVQAVEPLAMSGEARVLFASHVSAIAFVEGFGEMHTAVLGEAAWICAEYHEREYDLRGW